MQLFSKSVHIKSMALMAWIFLIWVFPLEAQQKGAEEERIYKLAFDFFEEENYQRALPYFEELLRLYSREPVYNYHYGVCLYETGKPAEAIDFLRYAATGDVPSGVYYYLGRAYHLNYEFYKAVSFYKRYKLFSEQLSDKEKIRVDRLINMCYNGEYLIQYASLPTIQEKQSISSNLYYKPFAGLETGGRFVELPGRLRSSADVKSGERFMFFLPDQLYIGEYVYFSSYGTEGKKDRDIYRTQKISATGWGDPRLLGENINTPYDEKYPFFHAGSHTLYFASKGHYSMGGFDLFKALYDEKSDAWSPPENLDFPVNSPHDDFMYVPDLHENKVMFLSSRNGQGNQWMVYELDISEKLKRSKIENIEQVLEIASLFDRGTETPAEEVAPPAAIQEGVFFDRINQTYNELLNDALTLQARADSLGNLMRQLRASLAEASGAGKTEIYRQMNHLNEIIAEIQDRADKKYRELRELEVTYLARNINLLPAFSGIEKVLLDSFIVIPEVREILGPKGLQELEEINERIEELEKEFRNISRYDQEILKWRIKKAESEFQWFEKRAERKIEKGKEKRLEAQVELYRELHQQYRDKYLHINRYIPLAREKGEKEVFLEKGKELLEQAKRMYQKSQAIYHSLDSYTPENRLQELKAVDSLNQSGIDKQQEAFLTFLAYDVYEEKKKLQTAMAKEKASFQQFTEDSIQEEGIGLMVQSPDLKLKTESEIRTDTMLPEVDSIPGERQEKAEGGSRKNEEFALLAASPYSENNPIPVNAELPAGVIYRIQLGAFSKELPPQTFGGLYPVTADYNPENEIYKYYAGLFNTMKSANSALSLIKKKGYRDAYIIAYLDGNLISTTKAQALEGDAASYDYSMGGGQKDSIVYKIQIGAFRGEMPQDILETFRRLAPESEIEKHPANDNIQLYTLGRFSTYRKASVLKEFLVGKGHEGIFIVAFKGDEKVPVPESVSQD